MPLYYKKEGSVIASFVQNKGCQGLPSNSEKCLHTDVQVVRCKSILHLINATVELMKVDIEMLHHTCIRGLHNVNTALLPRTVCWEEHDKPFGPAQVKRPLTDAKLLLGLYELGYSQAKIVMQGPRAAAFYGLAKEVTGYGQGSGKLTPDEMMHYRSYESHDGTFDSDGKPMEEIFLQGIFGPGKDKPENVFRGNTYYDLCVKLSPNAETLRQKRQDPESFPLDSLG